MRPASEAQTRWDETAKHGSSISDLQRAVKFNGPTSPCVAGCRSVCWKTFLLFQGVPSDDRLRVLRESRSAYASLRDRFLKYIEHPELLAALSSDPLADDPDSPWNAVRLDDVIRAEILQDVQRLPDEPLYRQESTQALILDILFIHCKLNPDVGGYRQGMHELLAPFVYVLHQDAIDKESIMSAEEAVDPVMTEVCDSEFIEHDAFTLFSRLMANAKPFYEVGDQNGGGLEQNVIVEKSKRIHEVALMKVDPELATHLKIIEILPQIFLIRWIRLLFSREFPFERLLVLWDTVFAFDPSLDLIDLVCVAMLLRIRWTLLEADYSSALQLLLKYPAPEPPHGPHTFVDDAVYLRDHLNAFGGSNLILKYTGKSPALSASTNSQLPTSISLQAASLRQRTLGPRSPLRPLTQTAGVEALLQGAAKGMLERGEKLGINQAVREAVGEIRRNMQGFQDSRNPMRSSPVAGATMHSVAAMERRNRQLGAMLDETITSLKNLATAKLEDKEGAIAAVELAAAKIQFVKAFLEDSSLAVPNESASTPTQTPRASVSYKDAISPTVALDTTEVTTTTAVEDAMAALALPSPSGDGRASSGTGRPPVVEPLSPSPRPPRRASPALPPPPPAGPKDDGDDHRMDTDDDPFTNDSCHASAPSASTLATTTTAEPSPAPSAAAIAAAAPAPPPRPKAPIPTRSTLAQSSFAWMLEPDEPAAAAVTGTPSSPLDPSAVAGAVVAGAVSPPQQQQRRKRPSAGVTNSASRNKNAFLFGEVTAEGGGFGGAGGGDDLTADKIFGLQPLPRKGQ